MVPVGTSTKYGHAPPNTPPAPPLSHTWGRKETRFQLSFPVLRGILGMEKLMSNVKVGVKKKKHVSKDSKKMMIT